ncbi:MAG TPA: hypothetical protein VFI96_05485, partial [Longimicrobiaceae bacterium]|nr:hypothetical protein [Longimicrobiaceae bacterium]
MEVLAQLNPHLRTLGIAVPSKIGDSRGVAAMELFTARRFDLAAKHLYARHRLLGVEDGWARRVYEAHLEAFNGFVEADGSGKTGPAAFGAAFDAILDSVVEKGFDASESLVPLGRNGIIIDGAHRLAACLLHRQAVQIVELDHAGSAFDHRFFRERGLAEPFSDAIALEYCRLQPNAVQVLLFPSAKGQVARVRAIVEEYGYIAYEKEVELNRL